MKKRYIILAIVVVIVVTILACRETNKITEEVNIKVETLDSPPIPEEPDSSSIGNEAIPETGEEISPPVDSQIPIEESTEELTVDSEEVNLLSRDITIIAQTLYGECRGVPSDMEKAAVAWVILNRVDAGYSDNIEDIVSSHFTGYNPAHPIDEELYDIAEDVMIRWQREKSGEEDVGRIIPSDYLWFAGRDGRNHFRNSYSSNEYWDWSLENPYEN